MDRVDFHLSSEKKDFLLSLQGNLSEHLRRAVDEYIDKIKMQSVSASKSKRGDLHE